MQMWRGVARRNLWLADAMLLMVAIIWGSSYAVAKQALWFYPVLGFLAIRFGLTFILLVPQLRGAGQRAVRPGLPLGLVMLGIFLCETWGVMLTSASNAAFLISLCVVFTPFVEWAMLRQRPGNLLFAASALSLAGVWLLTGGTNLSLNLGDGLSATGFHAIRWFAGVTAESGVLDSDVVSGVLRHIVRALCAELGAGPYQRDAGVAADGLRAAVRRHHRRALARRTAGPNGVDGRPADHVGDAGSHAFWWAVSCGRECGAGAHVIAVGR